MNKILQLTICLVLFTAGCAVERQISGLKETNYYPPPESQGGDQARDIPLDTRYKPGSGGQMISFIPSLDLVITRQTGKWGEWEFEEYVRRAAAAVLSKPAR